MTENVEPISENSGPVSFDEFVVTLGDVMRGERATMGQSLDDAAKTLRISAEYLSAIENCDATAFPTPSFISGYVRSYAKFLGLDPQESFERFCAESGFDGVRSHDLNENPKRKKDKPLMGMSAASQALLDDPLFNPRVPNRPQPVGVMGAISASGLISTAFLLLLIAGIGFGGWKVLQEVQRVQFAPVNETPVISTDLAGLEDARPSGNQSENAEAILGTRDQAALDQLYRPQELEIPQLIARDGPIGGLDPEMVGILSTPPEEPQVLAIQEVVAPKVVEDGPPPIDIVAIRPAWIRVFQASGGVLFEKTLDAGQRYRVPADVADPLLRAGNSGSVFLMIGQEVYGPVGVKTGVARKVGLTKDQITEKYALIGDPLDIQLSDPVNQPVIAEVVQE